MQYVEFVCVGPTGAPLPYATVSVYQTGATTLAQLYNSSGSAISNPTAATVAGIAAFAAPNGVYDIQVTAGAYSAPLWQAVQIVDVNALATQVSTLASSSLTAGAVTYQTQAELYADLAHAAGTLGWVWGDSTAANNGLYVKSGSSGSGAWSVTGVVIATSESVTSLIASTEALITALGETYTQTIGMAGSPSSGTAIDTNYTVLYYNNPVQNAGPLYLLTGYFAGIGTINVRRYTKSGSTYTQVGSDMMLTVSGLTGPRSFSWNAPALSALSFNVGDYVGFFVPASGAAQPDFASPVTGDAESAAVPGNQTTISSPTDWTGSAQLQFEFSWAVQVLTTTSFNDALGNVSALQGDVTALDATVSVLSTQQTQTIGAAASPTSGSTTSYTYTFILDAPVQNGGPITSLIGYFEGNGTINIRRFTLSGSTYTQVGSDMVLTVSGLSGAGSFSWGATALSTLDFNIGDYIGFYIPGTTPAIPAHTAVEAGDTATLLAAGNQTSMSSPSVWTGTAQLQFTMQEQVPLNVGGGIADSSSYGYFSQPSSPGGAPQIVQVTKATGISTTITSSGANFNPSISADGSKVIYGTSRVGGFMMQTIPATGVEYPYVSFTDFVLIGDSRTTAALGYATPFAVLYPGRQIDNEGFGGQKTPEITSRFGAAPTTGVVASNTIPASGSVNVTSTTPDPFTHANNTSEAIHCSIGGVEGVLTTSNTDSSQQFTRDVSGSPVAVSNPATIVFDSGTVQGSTSTSGATALTTLWSRTAILGSGYNDIYVGLIEGTYSYSQATTLANIAEQVAVLKPLAPRFLVLGLYVGEALLQNAGSTNLAAGKSTLGACISQVQAQTAINALIALNAALAAAYPHNFVDLQTALADTYGESATVNGSAYTIINSTALPDGTHPGTYAPAASLIATTVQTALNAKSW